MTDVIDNIRERMYLKEVKDEAKQTSRKELEELYVETAYRERTGTFMSHNSIGALVLVAFLFGILLTTALATTQYSNLENTNYNTLGRAICQETGYGKYENTRINNNYITIDCKDKSVTYQE